MTASDGSAPRAVESELSATQAPAASGAARAGTTLDKAPDMASETMTERRAEADSLAQVVQRKGSFWGTLRAVGWSFFGVRQGAGYEQDVSQLNPLHVIVAGVLAAALFVLGLVLLVNWVVGSGAAGV